MQTRTTPPLVACMLQLLAGLNHEHSNQHHCTSYAEQFSLFQFPELPQSIKFIHHVSTYIQNGMGSTPQDLEYHLAAKVPESQSGVLSIRKENICGCKGEFKS